MGVICLVLTNDINKHHVYDIPGCIFDPESHVNILGVQTLGKFFTDNVYVNSPFGETEIPSNQVPPSCI